MEKEEIKQKLKALDEEMYQRISDEENERLVCYDGAVNIDEYLDSKIKILWLLKEPYDEENGIGGGHTLGDLIKKDVAYDFVKKYPTWQVMTYVSYGILNDFWMWDDMNFLRIEPTMTNALLKIAMVNVQKLPSLNQSKTNFNDITEAFEKHGDLLKKQIDLLNPDILIAGNTMWIYKDMFGLIEENKKTKGCIDYWEKDGKLFIDAYHPSQKTETRENYCNDIISTVQKWFELKNSKVEGNGLEKQDN